MSLAAAAIAGGDFDQRLPTGLVPDEIFDLAQSYNRMAITLGETFSALREREQEIAAVVEAMGEGVVAFDAGGCVRVMNPEAMELLQLDGEPAEIVDRALGDITDSPQIVDLVDTALDGSGASATTELGPRSVLLNSTPITADEGVVGAVLLMADVTEQKRLEEAQRRFVANASHEMRTPIAALKGLLELLDGGAKEDAEVRDDFLHTMSLEVDRLGRLVADLLTLAQLEAGNLKLHREDLLVVELLGDVATIMHPLADGSGIGLAVATDDETQRVLGDRDRITQVLVGFVDNALKHSSQGDTVTLAAATEGRRVRISVRDRGMGIDPELVPRLFDRFYRVDESRAAPKGTGLGLSIAKEIVEAHGSAIEVESAPGDGTTFSFTLPTSR